MLLQTAVSGGGSLFKQLPPETQAILRPFLHSKYIIQSTRESAGGGTTAAPGASGGDAGGASLPPQPLARSASDADLAAGANTTTSAAATAAVGGAALPPLPPSRLSLTGPGPGGTAAGGGATTVLVTSRPSSFRRWLELWLRSLVRHTQVLVFL
jgi:hypothetical protein